MTESGQEEREATDLEAALARLLPRLRAFVRLNVDAALRAKESCSDLVSSVCREVLENKDRVEYRGDEALRAWLGSVRHPHYIIGPVAGPHPLPTLVRDFQSVIGIESREQCLATTGKLPDVVIACVGGGSNAAGMFYPFIQDAGVRLIGVEAGGRSSKPGEHAATLSFGSPGVLHGSLSYVLQDRFGQTADVHS